MIPIKRRKLRRVLAPIINRRDLLATILRRLRRSLRCAAIILDKAVADLPARGDGQDTVLDAVLAVQCNGIVAARAARQSRAGEDGDGTEVLCVAARETEAHCSTVREAKRETQVLIHA